MVPWLLAFLGTFILGAVCQRYLLRPVGRVFTWVERSWTRHRHGRSVFAPNPSHLALGGVSIDWVPLAGSGEEPLVTDKLVARLDPRFVDLPPELQDLADRKRDELEGLQRAGDESIWNGKRFSLQAFQPTRDAAEEREGVRFDFRLTDYATYLAITAHMHSEGVRGRSGKVRTIAQQYYRFDPAVPVTAVTHSFGVTLAVVTKDISPKLIVLRRGGKVARSKHKFHASVGEGMQYPMDLREDGHPSFLKTVSRGLDEELGIPVCELGDPRRYVQFLNFGVLESISEYGLIGRVLLPAPAALVERWFHDRAKDRDLESTHELFFVGYDLDTVSQFLATHGPWTHHGLAAIYFSLVAEFGYIQTRRSLDAAGLRERVLLDEPADLLTGG